MMRHAGLALLVAALGLPGAAPAAALVPGSTAAAAPVATAEAASPGDSGVTIDELDLAGVDTGALASLPADAPLPAEQAVPGSPTADAAPPQTPDTDAAENRSATGAAPISPLAPTADAPAPDVLTAELDTDPFLVFGVTWAPGPEGVVIRYRVREQGTWSEWQATGASDVAPDADRAEAADPATRGATDPIVTSDADGVQLWAEAAEGTVSDLKVALIDPGSREDDSRATDSLVSAESAATGTGVTAAGEVMESALVGAASAPPMPAIISRAGWGADESMRACQPDYSTEYVSAAVHHTASANGYSAEAVPGIIRGFYAYHTLPEASGGRGWCDIGYNFLVDRFGRIFEGRAGGISSTVVGVHTGGFNSRTIGVAAIGDYSTAGVPGALPDGISQLLAWKFSVHRISAGTSVRMVSGGGASKYPEGTVVEFPTIYGHRDAQLTACPGQNLYDWLPNIRARVAELADAAVSLSPLGSIDTLTSNAAGIRVAGWAFDPETSASISVEVDIDGQRTVLVADQERADIGQLFPAVGSRHGFGATVAAPAGRHVVCLLATNVGAGSSTVLGCRVLTVVNAGPLGSLDGVTATPTSISATGWALDPDTTASLTVHVYVDGVVTAARADRSRPDVGAMYGKGDLHGFAVTVPVAPGDHEVCVYALDSQGGINPQLGCRTVQTNPTPLGSFDIASGSATAITVGGWAMDPDTSEPIDVHVYVDGAATAVRADASRSDIAALYGNGDRHGFSARVAATTGVHSVCVYAINAPTGTNVLLGCRSVTVSNPLPVGHIDFIRTTTGAVVVGGWAFDPDTTAPIDVHVYVDGVATVLSASQVRTDVGALYGNGDRHGFSGTIRASAGVHRVCVYGINSPAGTNSLLGCIPMGVENATPVGSFDIARVTTSNVTVGGWALDPDSSAPIDVHVYVDSVAVAVRADQSRSDIAALYGKGDRHGFLTSLPVSGGAHRICVYAINTPSDVNVLLGCRSVQVG